MTDKGRIIIVGAGISGLVAAAHLESAGLAPLVLEASNRPGGRVKTDNDSGYLFDHGFQVLLTAYREVRQYLDVDALELCPFEPGAIIYQNSRKFRIGDPMRDPSVLLRMVFSGVGSPKDKYLIWKLSRSLKSTAPEILFSSNQPTTLEFLRSYGFSDAIIERFFMPFFGGIFLEQRLETSAAMFRFVFKMFAEGHAAIPKLGMEMIPGQLAKRLHSSEFRYGCTVREITSDTAYLDNGSALPFDRILVATDPAAIIPNLKGQEIQHQTTTNLYFSSDHSPLERPLIALSATPGALINNWVVLSDVSPAYAPPGKSLLSVSLRNKDANIDHDTLIGKVVGELREMTGLRDWRLDFLKRYDIPNALPVLEQPAYALQAAQHQLSDRIFLAGDYLLNGSLDAAMRSGRTGAQALLASLQ